MTRCLLIFIFTGLLSVGAADANALRPPVRPHDPKLFAASASNQLGLDLYRQLAKGAPDGNLVISPYSIESALVLAYAGADGTTRSEMAAALHFPADDAAIQSSFGGLRTALDRIGAEDSVELYQANQLFGQQGYAFRPDFLTLMQKGYGAPWEPLDFRANPENARKTINDWVGAQTRRKINDLIPSGGTTDHTRLVLVNALYLKARWAGV